MYPDIDIMVILSVNVGHRQTTDVTWCPDKIIFFAFSHLVWPLLQHDGHIRAQSTLLLKNVSMNKNKTKQNVFRAIRRNSQVSPKHLADHLCLSCKPWQMASYNWYTCSLPCLVSLDSAKSQKKCRTLWLPNLTQWASQKHKKTM